MVGQIILHLAAPNTPSGNPNRVFVAVDLLTGEVSAAFPEGYLGAGAVSREWRMAQRGAVVEAAFRIPVSASVVRDFLKEGRAAMALRDTPEGKRRYP